MNTISDYRSTTVTTIVHGNLIVFIIIILEVNIVHSNQGTGESLAGRQKLY